MQFILQGAIVPKARPRGAGKHHYLPKPYREWKDTAIATLRTQYHADPISEPVKVTVLLTGKHSRRGDADNVVGSILDALVQAEILVDDNMAHVVEISVRLEHSKETAIAIIDIDPI